jgi:1-acyl-sn-glycerol-3-phosphate acyltransferase
MSKIVQLARLPLGLIAAIIIISATALLPVLVISFFALKFIIPTRALRQKYVENFIYKMPYLWCMLTKKTILLSTFGYWDFPDTSALSKGKHYLIIANHQSWFDIIVIAISTYKKVPPYRFFMKRELLWQLPIAGLMCKILGFPFLKRHTRAEIKQDPSLRENDITTTRKACASFKDYPTTFVNFSEGTRFTQAKHNAGKSRFKYLLNPRPRGCSIILSELKNQIAGIIDLTICYSDKKPCILKLFFGKTKHIRCNLALLPLTADLAGNFSQDEKYRTHFQGWMEKRWQIKDAILDKFHQRYS